MAESRIRDEWNRTASVMALLANVNRDSKKRAAYKPSDFHPQQEKKSTPLPMDGFKMMKSVFVDHKP